MLPLMHQRGDIGKISGRRTAINWPAQNPGGNLPVKDHRRDIGMIGRHLADPAMPAIRGQAHKRNFGGGETFQPDDLHGSGLQLQDIGVAPYERAAW